MRNAIDNPLTSDHRHAICHRTEELFSSDDTVLDYQVRATGDFFNAPHAQILRPLQVYQQRKVTRGVHTGLDLLVVQICESGDEPYPCILSVWQSASQLHKLEQAIPLKDDRALHD